MPYLNLSTRLIAKATLATSIFALSVGAASAQQQAVPTATMAYAANPYQPTAVPRGRSQTAGQAPTQRAPTYAGARPQTSYAPQNAKAAYRSQAYGSAAQAPKAFVGGRVELRTGWDHVRADSDTAENQADGALYGLGFGYDKMFGKFFVGGFAGIDWSTAVAENATSSTTTGTLTIVTIDSVVEQSPMRDMEVGLRAGYRVNKYISAYGLAALTNAKSEVVTETTTTTDLDPSDPGVTIEKEESTSSFEQYQDGWRIGAGSEFEIIQGVFGKAEYRYSNYGTDELGDDVTRHQVMTGIGMRF